MGSIENISELCRLCLVKDQVNVPIFEENASKEQTFVKINSCLPVKVSRDDSLPKKICDGCSCKLDMLYNFRNTSVDSEKQLLKWLNQADLSCSQSAAKDPLASTKPEIMIKQETFEPTDSRGDDNSDMGMDTHSYLMQQQKLPYPQEFEFGGPSESNVGLMTDEPAPKRAKRAAALNKAPIETDDDDLDAAMQITKAEEEDSEEIDQPDYVEAPSTSADDQPGPSGVGKASVEAPSYVRGPKKPDKYCCNLCKVFFSTSVLLFHHEIQVHGKKYTCEYCGETFFDKILLLQHSNMHKQNNKFPCFECDAEFKAYFLYVYHKRVHKKITCEVCGEVFRGDCAKLYENHCFKEHLSNKVACDVCNRIFSWSYINKHKEIHVEQRPTLRCSFCTKGFSTSAGLKSHMEQMHEHVLYICVICEKILMSQHGLTLHMRQHTVDNRFVCGVCGKKFPRGENLKAHQRVHTFEKSYT
ncbi:zinc finger protein 184-like isoform X50 [Tribolium madens]|uniref:zinc finger protein 184-like isoform X50 n=1 Tax=Tribolium madens TaxID=41895 RepID=UPI001CF75BF9|nr:zinc finger protein 184-like isoform X50 [Tribolium madens]